MTEAEFTRKLSLVLSRGSGLDALSLDKILDATPSVDELDSLPQGTPVLLRLDLDVPIHEGAITDDSRLVSALETLSYCRGRGWKTVVFGHLGRDGKTSLEPVRQAIGRLLGTSVLFFEHWVEHAEGNLRVVSEVAQALHESTPGTILLLENTRKYDFERALWGKTPPLDPKVVRRLFTLARDVRHKLCRVEINEAIAASNHDFSSTVLPLLMDTNGVGFFLAQEFRTHVRAARTADLIVFSGLKANKLDDLECIIDRGAVRIVISAGSIAMALRKAEALVSGTDFSLGQAETDASLKSYIGKARIDQGIRIVRKCREKDIRLVLPIDFVLDNGKTSSVIPQDAVQLDVGPRSRDLFSEVAHNYAAATSRGEMAGVLYYNGVFGRFEDDRFAQGTKAFIQLLGRLTKAGVRTYVGGGEGRLALSRYGSINDVTHAFTCGGTILKSLTNHHIGFLKAMYAASAAHSTSDEGLP